MVESWMPIVANTLLFVMGLLFVLGGSNVPSRVIGVVCVIIAALSIVANVGV